MNKLLSFAGFVVCTMTALSLSYSNIRPLFAWLTAINVFFLVIAHLNTWLPLTFRVFLKVSQWYSCISDNIYFAYIGFMHAYRHRKIITSREELQDLIYGKDASKWAVVSFRFNWLAFMFWQILIVWIVGF